MSNHTPGPWIGKHGNRTNYVRGIYAAGNKPVVTWGGIGSPTSIEGIANARLIAAAPDLLEAVLETRKLVSEAAMTGFNFADGDWAERLFLNQGRLSAAIAKAEGRS